MRCFFFIDLFTGQAYGYGVGMTIAWRKIEIRYQETSDPVVKGIVDGIYTFSISVLEVTEFVMT